MVECKKVLNVIQYTAHCPLCPELSIWGKKNFFKIIHFLMNKFTICQNFIIFHTAFKMFCGAIGKKPA